jgi:hypothetical protein
MADSLDRTKRTAADLRAELKAGPSMMRVAIPAFVGSFAAGYADAKMPTLGGGKVQTSAAAGLVLVTGGYFSGYESAVWAGLACLQAQAYAAGVKQAGYDLAIIETKPDETAPANV